MQTKTKVKTPSVREIAVGLISLAVVTVLAVWGLSALFGESGGAAGGAIAGGVVAVFVALISKAFDYQKQHEANILEKRKDVYRKLLHPWERLLAQMADGADVDDAIDDFDRSAYYSSCFDAVLYGSDDVLQKFVAFRAQDDNPDNIDNLMLLADLLLAMRKDVTAKTPNISSEVALKMFINFQPEELVVLRLREHVRNNEEAQRKLAKAMRGEKDGDERQPNSPDEKS